MSVTPSLIMGLTQGSYEAYCLDQAAWYLGSTIENELSKVGHKRTKAETANEASRTRILAKYFGEEVAGKPKFADPAALFSS